MSGNMDEIVMECELDYDEDEKEFEGVIPHRHEHLTEYTRKRGKAKAEVVSASVISQGRLVKEQMARGKVAMQGQTGWGRREGSKHV
ncbi:hypothetical protein NDU88_007615 [Pleurodeles waltl]|uniref:Uncharacterized protein n=1 Tax=Pleurodeles waltl TaxID=8319 RepID=A0AAV7VSY8_PLEWA|nr:hypothetical protein NDU88_007615 [Pleurodeles waltl]